MLAKTITYVDYNDNEVTETFHFNLSRSEIAEMELASKDELFSDKLKKIVADGNPSEIIRTFKELIGKSYGKRSEDGKRFQKSDEISREFIESAAYSDLFFEMVTDAESAAQFIRGVMPSSVVTELDKAEATIEQKPWELENREPTKDELMRLSSAELKELYVRKTSSTES